MPRFKRHEKHLGKTYMLRTKEYLSAYVSYHANVYVAHAISRFTEDIFGAHFHVHSQNKQKKVASQAHEKRVR